MAETGSNTFSKLLFVDAATGPGFQGLGQALKSTKASTSQLKSEISELEGNFSKLFAALGAWYSIDKTADRFININKSMILTSNSLKKYGVSVKEADNIMESFSKTIGITRENSLELMKIYEKGFPLVNMKKAEQLMINIRNATGANVDAMKDVMSTLENIISEYPELQKSVEDMTASDKERLKVLSRTSLITGKMSLQQVRSLQDYISGNAYVSEQQREQEEQLRRIQESHRRILRTFEGLGLIIGETLVPYMQKVSDFLDKNKAQVKDVLSFIAKWGTQMGIVAGSALIISKALKVASAPMRFLSKMKSSGISGMLSGYTGVTTGAGGESSGVLRRDGSSISKALYVTDTTNLAKSLIGKKGKGGATFIPGSLKKPKSVGRLGKLGGKAMKGGIAGVLLAAAGIGASYLGSKAEDSGYETTGKTLKEAGKGLGIAGGVAGGAAIGTVVGAGPWGTAIGGIIGGLAAALPMFVDFGKIIGKLKDYMKPAIEGVKNLFAGFLPVLELHLKNTFSEIKENASNLWSTIKSIGSFMVDVFKSAVSTAKDVLNSIVGTIKGIYGFWKSYVFDPMISVATTIYGAWKNYIFDPMISVATTIYGAWKNYIFKPIVGTIKLIYGAWKKYLFDPVISLFSSMVETIKTVFEDTIVGKSISRVVGIVDKGINMVKNIFQQGWGFVLKAISSIPFLGDLTSAMIEEGKSRRKKDRMLKEKGAESGKSIAESMVKAQIEAQKRDQEKNKTRESLVQKAALGNMKAINELQKRMSNQKAVKGFEKAATDVNKKISQQEKLLEKIKEPTREDIEREHKARYETGEIERQWDQLPEIMKKEMVKKAQEHTDKLRKEEKQKLEGFKQERSGLMKEFGLTEESIKQFKSNEKALEAAFVGLAKNVEYTGTLLDNQVSLMDNLINRGHALGGVTMQRVQMEAESVEKTAKEQIGLLETQKHFLDLEEKRLKELGKEEDISQQLKVLQSKRDEISSKIEEKQSLIVTAQQKQLDVQRKILQVQQNLSSAGESYYNTYIEFVQRAGAVNMNSITGLLDSQIERYRNTQTEISNTINSINQFSESLKSISSSSDFSEKQKSELAKLFMETQDLSPEEAQEKVNKAIEEGKSIQTLNKELQAEIIGLKEQSLQLENKIEDAAIAATHAYDQRQRLAQKDLEYAEGMVNLIDNMAVGVGASASMRLQAVNAAREELDWIKKAKKVAEEKMAVLKNENKVKELQEQGIDVENERLKLAERIKELRNEELNNIQKQTQMLRQLRDGWISAISASTNGQGMITKIMVDQNKNLAASMSYFKGIRSNVSGAVRRRGETGVGTLESQRFNIAGGISGGSGIGYISDVDKYLGLDPMLAQQSAMGGARADLAGMFSGATDVMTGNMRNPGAGLLGGTNQQFLNVPGNAGVNRPSSFVPSSKMPDFQEERQRQKEAAARSGKGHGCIQLTINVSTIDEAIKKIRKELSKALGIFGNSESSEKK